jgi:hypothetical protein
MVASIGNWRCGLRHRHLRRPAAAPCDSAREERGSRLIIITIGASILFKVWFRT